MHIWYHQQTRLFSHLLSEILWTFEWKIWCQFWHLIKKIFISVNANHSRGRYPWITWREASTYFPLPRWQSLAGTTTKDLRTPGSSWSTEVTSIPTTAMGAVRDRRQTTTYRSLARRHLILQAVNIPNLKVPVEAEASLQDLSRAWANWKTRRGSLKVEKAVSTHGGSPRKPQWIDGRGRSPLARLSRGWRPPQSSNHLTPICSIVVHFLISSCECYLF